MSIVGVYWHTAVFLTWQAPAEDHSDGAGLVPADLRDGGELSVSGRGQSGDTHAAELPELRPAAARLRDRARHSPRSGRLLVLAESKPEERETDFQGIHCLAVRKIA